jgi:uncharacterized protein, YigZ family
MAMKPYQQLTHSVVFELEEKRSRFLCYLYPVTSREQSLMRLESLRVEFPDARHHCWAYVIGDPKQPITQAYNDDGEPAGTAGKPILNVLVQRGAGDACAIVVRYFGGIKLGAGGLVRAYGSSVSQALDHATLAAKIPLAELSVLIDFNFEAVARRLVARCSGEVLEVNYGVEVTLVVVLPIDQEGIFRKALQSSTSGSATIQA